MIGLLLVVFILVSFILASPFVQTRLAKYATAYLSGKLHTEVNVDRVGIYFFDHFSLRGVLIRDYREDTLLYVEEVDVRLAENDAKNNRLVFNQISLERPQVFLHRYAGGDFNFMFLLDSLRSGKESTSPGQVWKLGCGSFHLHDGQCAYLDDTYQYESGGIDYWDMLGKNIHLDASDISVDGDTIRADVGFLHLEEKSGLVIDTLSSALRFAPGDILAKDFHLITGNTNINTDAELLFNDVADFSDYIDSVRMVVDVHPSILNLKDIGYFAPVLFPMDNEIRLTAKAKGTVSNFKAKKLNFAIGRNTQFRGKIRMRGLPDIRETFTQLKVKEFYSSMADIEHFNMPEGVENMDFLRWVKKIGEFSVKGNFTGFYNDFVSFATYRTEVGGFSTDIKLSINKNGVIEYDGLAKGFGVAAGYWLDIPEKLHTLDFDLRLQGQDLNFDRMRLNLDGEVRNIGLNGRIIRKLNVLGELRQKKFTGNVKVDDDMLAFDFDGLLDFSRQIPRYNFVALVRKIDLKSFGFFAGDSLSLLSTRVDINAIGESLNDMQGRINLSNILLARNQTGYQLGNLNLSMTKDAANYRIFGLRSDIVDANMEGAIDLQSLPADLHSVLHYYLPHGWTPAGKMKTGTQDFVFDFTFKKLPLLAAALWDMDVKTKTLTGGGEFVNSLQYADLSIHSGSLEVFGSKLLNPELKLFPKNNKLYLNFSQDAFYYADTLHLDRPLFSAEIYNDSISYALSWNNIDSKEDDSADIRGVAVLKDGAFFNHILPSSALVIHGESWKMNPRNSLMKDSLRWRFEHCAFTHNQQLLALDGSLSPNPGDSLLLEMKKLDIRNFRSFYSPYGLEFGGLINGGMKITYVDSLYHVLGEVNIDSLSFNKEYLGDAKIHSYWNEKMEAIHTDMDIISYGNIGSSKSVSVKGDYYPNRRQENFDFYLSLNNFKLSTLKPFVSVFSSRLGGFASGRLHLSGTPASPYLLGQLRLKRVKLLIDYTNTEYYFADKVIFDTNRIHMDSVLLTDPAGNKAIVNASFDHHYFNDLSYRIDVHTDKLEALHTDISRNEYFYGDALVKGSITIEGDLDKVNLDIDAKPLKTTKITLPINNSVDLVDNDYIIFVKPDDSLLPAVVPAPPSSSSVMVNTQLSVNENTDVNLIMPYDMGTISAKGTGDLSIIYDERGELSLTGEYIIGQGKYLMNLQDVLNRVFTVEPGSKITWSGDPYDADINIKAVYDLRTRLGEYAPSDDSSAIVPVQCVISMGNSLMEPSIHFGIEFPDLNEDVKQSIYSRLDTSNQALMSRQVISLMVLHSFNYNSGYTSSLEANTFSLFTNQINSWLSGLSDDFDIGIKYRPGDNITEDELGVMLSTQLFNDRVIVKGNVGVKNRTSVDRSDSFIGEGEIEVKLTPDGRLRLKAFNTSNNDYLFQDYSRYTQGVGIFYRREFDTFKELFMGDRTE